MKTLATIRESINNSVDLLVPRGSLNIPRHKMPQIAGNNQKEFLYLMRALGASVESVYIRADLLKAAQSEINEKKVREWMTDMPPAASAKPCLISQDNYVLDGNHTWLSKLNRDPECRINCVRIGFGIEELLNNSKLFDKATSKTVNEDTTHMHFDEIPDSLLAKIRNILSEGSADPKKKKKSPPPPKKDEDDSNTLSGKKEKVTLNPEVVPDAFTSKPFKLKTTVK